MIKVQDGNDIVISGTDRVNEFFFMNEGNADNSDMEQALKTAQQFDKTKPDEKVNLLAC